MIIFLYGQDSFRSYQKLKEIIHRYKEKFPESLSFKKLDGKRLNLENFKLIIQGSALFQEKKLIVIKDIFNIKVSSQKEVVEFLKNKQINKDDDNIIVFWNENTVDKRTSLFRFLNKNARSQGFSKLNSAQTEKWIYKMLAEYFPDLKLNLSIIRLLAQKLNCDLWRIYNEILKINAYSKNSSKSLTEKELGALIVFPCEADIFKTIDAIASKNKKQALRSLAIHFKNLEPELKLLAMFEYQFRGLARIRTLINKQKNYRTIQKETKIHPFAFRKMYQLAQNFSMNEIGKIYDELLKLDIGFKTGKIQNKQVSLEMFVIRLCRN